jgi:hypothetical protein
MAYKQKNNPFSSPAKQVKDVSTDIITSTSSASGVTDQDDVLGDYTITKKDATRKVENREYDNEKYLKSYDNPTDREKASSMGYDIDDREQLLEYIQKKGEELGYRSSVSEEFEPFEESSPGDVAANKTRYEQRMDMKKLKGAYKMDAKSAKKYLKALKSKKNPTEMDLANIEKLKFIRKGGNVSEYFSHDSEGNIVGVSDSSRALRGDPGTFQGEEFDYGRIVPADQGGGYAQAVSAGLVEDTPENRKKYNHKTKEEIKSELSNSSAKLKTAEMTDDVRLKNIGLGSIAKYVKSQGGSLKAQGGEASPAKLGAVVPWAARGLVAGARTVAPRVINLTKGAGGVYSGASGGAGLLNMAKNAAKFMWGHKGKILLGAGLASMFWPSGGDDANLTVDTKTKGTSKGKSNGKGKGKGKGGSSSSSSTRVVHTGGVTRPKFTNTKKRGNIIRSKALETVGQPQEGTKRSRRRVKRIEGRTNVKEAKIKLAETKKRLDEANRA